MRRHPRPIALALSALIVLAVPRASTAQALGRDRTTHAHYLALNVAIGATASMARAAVSGKPMRTAFLTGLLGGSLMSTGMELIGTEHPGVRFAGLQLTAIGASVARNVDTGASPFADLTLPVYPFFVRVQPGSPQPVTARLSVMSTVRLASALAERRGPRIDWGATMVTGAPVLRSPRWRLPSESCPPPCEGSFAQHNAGIVVYSASAGTDYDLRRTLAHESLHLAQQTRDAVLDAIPMSDAALARFGVVGRTMSRFLVIDVVMPLRIVDEGEARMRGAPRRDSWYEMEARAFAPGGERR